MPIKRSSPPSSSRTHAGHASHASHSSNAFERPSGKIRVRPVVSNASRQGDTLERQAFPIGLPRSAEVPTEIDRVKLIAELSRILRDPAVPNSTRMAGLTLVGWLARRMPGEAAHTLGCDPDQTMIRSR
jgi:hypothetical protein